MSGDPVMTIVRCYGRRPPETGGMELHIDALSREQRTQGARVIDVFNQGAVDGEAVRVLGRFVMHRWKPTILREAIFYAVAAWRLRHLRHAKGLVVHAHGDWNALLFGRWLAAWLGAAASVGAVHGRVGPGRRWRWSLRHDVVYATGRGDADALSAYCGRPVFHLPSAPADGYFEAGRVEGAVEQDVIAVGNLVAAKNYDLLLEVARALPDRRFLVCGEGPERARLEARRGALGLHNVEFAGKVPAERLRELLDRSSLFLHVATVEGSPTVALEAMARGRPVLITPSNDYRAFEEAGAARIVPFDASAIAGEVEALLADEGRREEMGRSARSLAQAHRWPAKAARLSQWMSGALKDKS